SLLDEFAGELTLLKSIPPGVDKTDCQSSEFFFPFSPIRIAPDLEASRARGFIHRPLKLQSLAYRNLIS
nr:hypothetical protein [Tanacetum cinerariifolium]